MQDCGLENFTIEIIEECETQGQANEREQFRINVLKSKMPKGYNRTNGGEGGTHKPRIIFLSVREMLAKRLKELRFRNDITQAEFVRALGVAHQTVASWESGRTEPSNTALRDIADYFNVSADYLLGRETPKAPALSDEQTIVLKGFDDLSDAGRNALMVVLEALLTCPARAAV